MNIKSFLFIVTFIVLSIPAVWQIITPGYFPMHDDTQIVRVEQMYKALLSGQFPVRWVPDLGYGYGYPIFNFYNPLPYYVGGLGMFLGFNALAATKLMFVLPIVGSLFSMYLFARFILSKWGALIAGILYLYAPYHGVQIYVRGSVAEYWAYAILPLIFWAILSRRVFAGGITLAVLIASHNLTAFLSIPFLVLLMIFRFFEILKKRKKVFFVFCFVFFIIGFGLSAFFWLPAVLESPKTGVSEMVFQEFDPPALHLVTPFQLWTSPWGYGGSSARVDDDGLSFQLGKIHVLGSVVAMVIWLYGYMVKKTIHNPNNLTIFAIFGLLFSLFLLFPFSAPVWNAFPVLSYIQFPWRFLTFATFFSSFLAALAIEGLVVRFVPNKTFSLLLIMFCILFITYSLKFFQPQFKYPTTVEEQTSREKIVWEVSKRSDEYLPIGFQRPGNLEEALRNGNKRNQALADTLKQQTPARTISNLISLVTIAGLTLWLVQSRRQLWNTR